MTVDEHPITGYPEGMDVPAVRFAPDICGAVSNSGPNGEPLACAYSPSPLGEPMHEHSWATLPTFTVAVSRDPSLADPTDPETHGEGEA